MVGASLSFAWLARFAFFLAFFRNEAMKLHEVGSANRSFEMEMSSDCRSNGGGNEKMVDSLSKDLGKSLGYDGMFYKGCLAFLHHNADPKIPMMAQVEAFGKRCKQALFVKDQSAMHQVDPNQLEAECDRAVYNMDVQFRLLGAEALKTAQEFCAVFVDMVLPIDEEPECMRFIEAVSFAHSEFLGITHSWPAIIHKPHFDEAFMNACLESKKLESEADGMQIDYGDGAKDCQLKMTRIQAMPLDKHYKHLSKFFADVCPMLGKDLPDHTKPTPFRKTSRSLHAALFHRAAKIVANSTGTNLTQLPKKKRKPFSALQVHLLDESVAGKGSSDDRRRRRRRRRLNHRQSTCCEQVARTYEVGLEASLGVAVGYSQIGAEGFQRWRGNDCEFKWGHLHELCKGVKLGAGVDASVSHGYFKKYDDIRGESWFKTAGVCFMGCAGGTLIETKAVGGTEIGKVIETGVGMGVDMSMGHCEAWRISEHRRWERNLKGKCPSTDSSGCFPGHAVVSTPQGPKHMRELRVGDQVLSLDAEGTLIFDDIYFFGHAEKTAWAPFVSLHLETRETETREVFEKGNQSHKWNLELTPDHFIQICPLANCSWEDSRAIPAAQVLPGHHVWVVTEGTAGTRFAVVISTQMVPQIGLYNPYTLSGNIVVNGVVASSHSSWLLDAWTPQELQHHLPGLYQKTFVLGRWLYYLFGAPAADVIGVNNNHELTEHATWAAHFLAMLGVVAPVMSWLCCASLCCCSRSSKGDPLKLAHL